jgi:hypothetical protein
MVPGWLHALAIFALLTGFVSAFVIALHVMRHQQRMWIMNVVWPEAEGQAAPTNKEPPFAVKVGTGAAHCGSGCTLGDIVAEWLAFTFPAVAVWFGWQTIFSEKMFAVWILDFLLAFAFGIVFQYFAIVPMRKLSFWPGLAAALKADTLSLIAWQVGMYGFMGFAQFYLFRTLIGTRLEVNTPEFWFMMQLAMLCGFVTAYPVNWWLITVGIKEAM